MAQAVRSTRRGPLARFLQVNRGTAAFGLAAVVVTIIVLLFVPPEREATSLVKFLLHLVPFFLAAESVARLTLEEPARRRAGLILVPVAFLGFFCYFIPRGFYLTDDFPKFYVNTLTMVPYVILSLALSHRLGGASTGAVRRLAVALILLMLSGLEDLAFLLVNDNSGTPFADIPDVWFWASHIEVFIGHPPTATEAMLFIAVHVLAAVGVLFAPARWFTR